MAIHQFWLTLNSIFCIFIQGLHAQEAPLINPPTKQPHSPIYEIKFRGWFSGAKGATQSMKKYASFAAGKPDKVSAITPIVPNTNRPALHFVTKQSHRGKSLLSIHVHPPVQGSDIVLALIGYENQSGNVTGYDLALVKNPSTSKQPGAKVRWHDWVLEEYSLKPDVPELNGIWRPYSTLGLPLQAPIRPLQHIDPEAIQIYYDTARNPAERGLGDVSGKSVADVHFVQIKPADIQSTM